MPTIQTALAITLAVAAPLWLAGCNGAANHSEKTPKSGEAHDHDHEHHHHGPHNGHLMELGAEEYHAEWTHDESGKVTFYILDAGAEKEVPIAAQHITIDVKVGENPPKTYQLEAVNPTDGKSAAFSITDKGFEGVFDQLKSPGLTLTIHVNINGKQFDQPVKEHEHEH
jgi:hypothetical protein